MEHREIVRHLKEKAQHSRDEAHRFRLEAIVSNDLRLFKIADLCEKFADDAEALAKVFSQIS